MKKIKWFVVSLLLLPSFAMAKPAGSAAVAKHSLAVTLDALTWPAGNLTAGTNAVPFTTLDFTTGAFDVSFNKLVVVSDSATAGSSLSFINAFINGTQVGYSGSLQLVNGVYQTTITFPSFIVPANSTSRLQLKADVPYGATGTLRLGLLDVGLPANTKLTTALPIYGNAQTVVAPAGQHAFGTNISAPDGTLWMISSEGTRRQYLTGTFLSYGFNSSGSIVPASSQDLNLPAGSFIQASDGSIACSDRGQDKGTCYEISQGKKYPFTSAQVFTDLGFNFSNAYMADLSFMNVGGVISTSTSAHLPNVLINNNGTVEYMGATGVYGIPDLATLNSWGLSFDKVVPANAADKALPQIGVLPARQVGQLNPVVW